MLILLLTSANKFFGSNKDVQSIMNVPSSLFGKKIWQDSRTQSNLRV